MKQVVLVIAVLISLISCSKDEVIKPKAVQPASNNQTPFQQQSETTCEPEAGAAVEVAAFSLKNESNVFGLFATYINEEGKPSKVHVPANSIVIIKAVPSSIQAPIDVIITAVDEELN